MKRALFFIIIFISTALSAWGDVVGDGTEESPWQVSTWADLQAKVAAGGHIILTADINMENYLTVSANTTVTLNLNGYKLDRGQTSSSGSGYIFTIKGSLTIKDENTGSYNANPSYVVNDETVTGGLITGAYSTSSNRAINVYSGGRLNLYGGTITGNYCDRNQNDSGLCGAGIAVFEGASFGIQGNPKVYGNKRFYYKSFYDDNIYVFGNTNKIQIDGPLTSGAELHVFVTADGNITNGYKSQNNNEDPGNYFIPEDLLFQIEWNNNKTEAKKTYYIGEMSDSNTKVTLKASDSAPNTNNTNKESWNALKNVSGGNPGWAHYWSYTNSVVFDSSFGNARPTNCHLWFQGPNGISITNLQYLNTSEVTNMYNMFIKLSNETLDVSHFNTEKVTNMSYMFNTSGSLTSLDISSFNTSNVTNMTRMFRDYTALTSLTIGSNFNTSNVTEYSPVFEGCSSLNTLIVKGATVPNITQEDFFAGITTLPALVVKDENGNPSDMLDNEVSVSTDGYVLWKGGRFSTINGKKLLKVNASIANWTYGSSASTPGALTGDDADKAESVTYAYKLKGSDDDFSSTAPTAAGTYILRALVTPNAGNSTEYLTTPVFVEFKILPITVGLNWNDPGELVYDGTAKTVTATATGLINGDACTVTVSCDDAVNAGTHTATATALNNSNYALPTTNKTYSFTINKKSVTVSGGITGANKVYDGTTTATVNTENAVFIGLVGDDALTVSATGTFADANVGEGKTVTISGLTLGGTSVSNYQLAESGHQASTIANITKKTLTVTADNQSRDYRAAEPTFTISYDGFVAGDSKTSLNTEPSATTTATASSPVGTYPITPSGGEATNYEFTYVAGTLTIHPKAVTLEWPTTTTFEYDGSTKVFKPTLTGVENEDDCTLTVNYDEGPYYEYTATAGTTGQTGGTITHFYHYLVDGVLTLPNVWCTFKDNKSNGVWYVEFNTAEPVNPISYTVVTGADTQSFPDRNPKSWVLKAKLIAGDEWTTIATVTNDSQLEAQNNKAYNYDLDVTGGTYQYFRFEVSERRGSVTSGYDAMQLAELYLTTSKPAPKEVGEHTAHVVALSNPNYALPNTVADLTKNFTITQKEVTLTWPGTTAFTYDGQAKDYKPTLGDVINNECALVMSYDDEYTSYSGYTGTAGSGDYSKVVDGDLTTKWSVVTSNRTNGVWFVEFNTSESICPVGYTLITGDNTASNSHLNPMFWKLKAKKTPGDDWTTIATVKNDNILQAQNKQAYDYRLDVIGESYQYYRLEISGAHKKTTATEWDTGMQLQDFHLLVPKEAPVNVGSHTAITALTNSNYKLPTTANHEFTIGGKNISSATITFDNNSVDYTGDPVKPTVTVSDLNGSTECITADDYEISGEGTDPGSYTLTVSAKANGNYTGSVTTEAYKIVYPLTPAKNYTTYVSPFDLQMPEGESGLMAYTVASVTDTEVILQEETAVFKNEPMILVGTAGTTYRLEKKDEGKTISASHSNKLKAGSVVCSADKYYYVLQNNGTGAEFVWANSGTVPVGKCYLDLGTTSGARNRSLSIVIDGNTTSLDDIINRDDTDDKWYDLQGRRIEQPQKKGLYILNGKKVVVK